MASTVDAIEELVICQKLTHLKARYCRCVDAKDWEGFAAVFAPDATLDFRGAATTAVGNGVLEGASVIVEAIRAAVTPMTTVHQCHTPEIEIVSPTEARAIWHMTDHLRWPEGSPIRAKNGYGYYHETYVKRGGEWKIQSTRLERVLNEVVPTA